MLEYAQDKVTANMARPSQKTSESEAPLYINSKELLNFIQGRTSDLALYLLGSFCCQKVMIKSILWFSFHVLL